MPYSKDQIINEIRAIAENLGQKSLKSSEWKKHSSPIFTDVNNPKYFKNCQL